MRTLKQWILSFLFVSALFSVSEVSYALAFNIAPKAGTTLPSMVRQGSFVLAPYTVTNLTQRTLTGAFVKYLPPNVLQVVGGGSEPNLCGVTFDLASGASCTLELFISGVVSASDPDPHHHIFVCTPNVPACAGTNFPLNVSMIGLASLAITPLDQVLAQGGSLQYTATGTYSDGVSQDVTTGVNWASSHTSIATIGSSTGLATGVSPGVTTISASLGSVSANTSLTVKAQFAYVTDALTNNAVTVCPVNSDNTFGTCSTPTTANFNDPRGIAINSSYTFAYVANTGGHTVSICPVSADGSLNSGSCTLSTVGGLLTGASHAQGIAVNAAASEIYITDVGGADVIYCRLLSDGSIKGDTCFTSTGSGTFNNPTSAVLNSAESILYVTNSGSDTISVCNINTDKSIGSCTASNPATLLSVPSMTILNAANTFAYISNNSNSATSDIAHNYVVICPINSDGTLKSASCFAFTDASFSFIEGIGINAANNTLYVANFANGTGTGGGTGTTVSICPITSNGSTLGTCTPSSGNGQFSAPFTAYIH